MSEHNWERLTKRAVLVSVVIAVALLTGCVRFTDTVPLPPESLAYELYGSRTVGQTFVCHHAGLNGIGVLLKAGAGDLVLHLREDAESASDITTVTISPPPDDAAVYHQFDVPLQDDVNGESFYLLLEAPDATSEDPFVVSYNLNLSSQYDLSLDGAELTPGQLSFQLHYSSLYIVKDLFRQAFSFGLRSLWLLFLSALFYLLPGGAVVVWLLREGDWIERTVVALGMSVAVYALLMYATMTGLRLGPAATIGFLALCAALIGVRWWLDWRGKRPSIPGVRDVWASVKRDPSPVALAFVFVLVLGIRIFVVRDLVAPMWGDGYHHTMIAQLMVDNGGLFDSWKPYAPLATFTYHFGFHANVALFHWLSSDTVIHSVIWIGQMLNALAVLALYPVALKVSDGNRWAGVGAVLVAGLLSPMPMYYVNWGRYTQLAGQVILPVLMWLTWRLTEQDRWDWRLIAAMVTALLGIGVTHYRVVLVYGLFVVAVALFLIVRRWGQWRWLGQVVLRLGVAGALVLLLFVPWGANIFRARIPKIAQYLVQHGSQNSFYREEYNAIGDVSFFVPWALLGLSLGALIWQSCVRQFTVWTTVLWTAMLLAVANPHRIGLPGTGLVNNFAVLVLLYIPTSILVGTLVGQVGVWAQRWGRWAWGLVAVVVVLGAGWSVTQRMKDLDLGGVLVTEADMNAMGWIRQNTPQEAKFLVNGFLAYGDSAVVGADGGWWIPLLTGRASNVPPAVYGMEVSYDTDDPWRPIQLVSTLQETSLSSWKGSKLLQDEAITYVYIGHGHGKVGNPGEPLLDASQLVLSPYYSLVYHQEGVWILRLAVE